MLSFPKQSTIERIGSLAGVNASPSQFIEMGAEDIANYVANELDGRMVIDVSKAPENERAPLREAAVSANITILGDNGDSSSEEDAILREINGQILEGEEGVSIGRVAFRRFIETLMADPKHYDLVKDEWNKFIVGHDHTGKISSPLESHHFPNVGVKKASEGEDVMRDEVVALVSDVMGGVRNKVEKMFEGEDFLDHDQPEMNEQNNRLLALGMAEWSNFVRGAAYYRYRRGEDSLDAYAPRRLAAEIIDQVKAELAA